MVVSSGVIQKHKCIQCCPIYNQKSKQTYKISKNDKWLVGIYKRWINKFWYIHVNKMRGNFLPLKEDVRFYMNEFVFVKAGQLIRLLPADRSFICFIAFKLVCFCLDLYLWVLLIDINVCPSVRNFLMTVWVIDQVTGSRDLLPIPGRDTPAAGRRSNQRWLTLFGLVEAILVTVW